MKIKGRRKSSMEVNQSPDVVEIPVHVRRMRLGIRILGIIVAVIFLASVLEEIYGNSLHVDHMVGQGKHSKWSTDSTTWLEGPLGMTTWALFKIPPLIALWLLCLKPSAIVNGRLKYFLVALFAVGVLMVSIYDKLN